MSDNDFDDHRDFVDEMTRLAQLLSNRANGNGKKLEVVFYTQDVGDSGFPDTICTLRYYPPVNSSASQEENAAPLAN